MIKTAHSGLFAQNTNKSNGAEGIGLRRRLLLWGKSIFCHSAADYAAAPFLHMLTPECAARELLFQEKM